ncbi:MAG: gephyrin-like molybdotransferase Glp [Thermoleophilaceae bacterium]
MAGSTPIPLEQARAAVLAEVAPLPSEVVALADALGRVLADDVVGVEAVPAFDNSAMDGYALRAADTDGASADRPAKLRIVGESRAGAPAAVSVGRGEAVRISTGAMLADGADAVLRQEDAAADGDRLEARAAVTRGRDVRRAGDDVAAGATALTGGSAIGPAELGVLAGAGRASVGCARRPVVHVVTTGDELVAAGEPLPPGGVRDSNSLTVPAQARRAGARTRVAARVPDDAGATLAALRDGLEADVLAICGGVSVGPHDHVKAALGELGIDQRFWRVALRPGGPAWFGVAERPEGRTLVFGLPGNPASAMVVFQLLARPALAALQGADPAPRRVTATLDDDARGAPGRIHAVRCRAEARDDGWHARITGPQGSHVLTSMLGANALALVEGDRRAGERVTIELLD